MSETVERPRSRETAISAALLRLLGASAVETAASVGVSPKTLQRWQASPWWADTQRAAAERWLAGLASKARRGLESTVGEDGRLALAVLERLEPALAPPRIRAVVGFDPSQLTDLQLSRIAAGEDPAAVLGGGTP